MEFLQIKEILFAEAKKAGLSAYDVYYRMGTDISADALNREPNASGFGTGGGVSFRCAVDGKMGMAATECITPEELCRLVPRAMENAALLDADEAPIFYVPEATDNYESVTAKVQPLPTAAELRHAAMDLQERMYAASSLVTDGTESAVGGAEISVSLANAAGLSLSHRATMRYAYAEAVINDGKEPSFGTAMSPLLDADKSGIAERAVEDAVARLGGTPVKTGKCKVIFSARQVRALFSAYSGIFNGKKALLGLSLLKGKEGTEIASPLVTLYDDPFYPENTMQMPFDAEGVPTKRKALIEEGVLKTLLYDLTTAKKAGKTTTGNAARGYADPVGISPFCLSLAAGDKTLDDLFLEMGEGLYITELKGLHAGCDAVTGDFSIECGGFVVSGGKRCGACRAFTVAGNFFSLLRDIVAVGAEVELGTSGFSAIAAPALLVRELSVAGEG